MTKLCSRHMLVHIYWLGWLGHFVLIYLLQQTAQQLQHINLGTHDLVFGRNLTWYCKWERCQKFKWIDGSAVVRVKQVSSDANHKNSKQEKVGTLTILIMPTWLTTSFSSLAGFSSESSDFSGVAFAPPFAVVAPPLLVAGASYLAAFFAGNISTTTGSAIWLSSFSFSARHTRIRFEFTSSWELWRKIPVRIYFPKWAMKYSYFHIPEQYSGSLNRHWKYQVCRWIQIYCIKFKHFLIWSTSASIKW